MDLNESFRKVWESWLASDRLDENIGHYLEVRQPFLALLDRSLHRLGYLPAGEELRVLEVGCGTAMISHHLARRIKARFFAIDLSPEAIELARRIGKKFQTSIELRVGDATKMGDFEDGFFHLIFSQGVMEHFHDPMPFMKEHLRILHKKGCLIVDVPQRFNPYTLYKRIKIQRGDWPYGWETEYSYPELRRLGNRLGLEVVDRAAWGAIPPMNSIYMDLFLAGGRPIQRAVYSVLRNAYNGLFWLLARLLPRYQPYFMMLVSVAYQRRADTQPIGRARQEAVG